MEITLPALVYTLCFAGSAGCAVLLGRTWYRTRMRLLFWSTLCFLLLAANNLFVIIDVLLARDIDFGIVRLGLTLAATAVLLFGFVWSSGEEA